jgi:hypothetical protein
MSLAVTTDGGRHWRSWPGGRPPFNAVYGGQARIQPGAVGCSQGDGCVVVGWNSPLTGGIFIARSTDGGSSWLPVSFPK